MSTGMSLECKKEILRQKILFLCNKDYKDYDWEFTDEQVRDWYGGCYELWFDGTEIAPDLTTKFRTPNQGRLYIEHGRLTNTFNEPEKFSAFAITAEGMTVYYDIVWSSDDYDFKVNRRGGFGAKPLTKEERYGLIMFIFETFEIERRVRRDWELSRLYK